MRARGVAILAVVAAVAAGCGEDDFANEPRPPVPVELTGVIQDDKVTISPSKGIGAGPFVITISNQTDAAHTLTLEGERITEEVGPVDPLDTATIQKTLDPGSYEVRAGSRRAVQRAIAPATLDVGEQRESSSSDLLLP
ncbi:MAG: hypothetical protein ACRDL0_13140 [Thermoleophilaceae bacterium]